MCPAVAVDKVITVGPQSFSLSLADGNGDVLIMPPSAHTGTAPVNTRLISARCRSGQVHTVIVITQSVTCTEDSSRYLTSMNDAFMVFYMHCVCHNVVVIQ